MCMVFINYFHAIVFSTCTDGISDGGKLSIDDDYILCKFPVAIIS